MKFGLWDHVDRSDRPLHKQLDAAARSREEAVLGYAACDRERDAAFESADALPAGLASSDQR